MLLIGLRQGRGVKIRVEVWKRSRRTRRTRKKKRKS
jgi:hypothetical protein